MLAYLLWHPQTKTTVMSPFTCLVVSVYYARLQTRASMWTVLFTYSFNQSLNFELCI